MGEGNRLQKGKCQGLPAYPGPDLLPLHAPLDLRLDLRQELLLLTMDAKGRCEDSSGDGCHCGGHRFHPWSEKIPHAASNQAPAPRLLRQCSRAAAAEPGCCNSWSFVPHEPQPEGPPQGEAHALQLEKTQTKQRRPSTAKKKKPVLKMVGDGISLLPSLCPPTAPLGGNCTHLQGPTPLLWRCPPRGCAGGWEGPGSLYEKGCALCCLPCTDGALVTDLVYLGWSSDGQICSARRTQEVLDNTAHFWLLAKLEQRQQKGSNSYS